jgi:hypothetical protein
MPSTPGPAPKQGAGQERPRNDTTHYVFMAGALSGVMEGVSIQPLEMIKTRFQINEGARLRIIPTIKDIIKEGGVLQLYRGGLPEIVGLMPRASASLSTLELSRRKFREWNGGELSTQHAFLSGALSGVSEGVAFSPFQVIKVRTAEAVTHGAALVCNSTWELRWRCTCANLLQSCTQRVVILAAQALHCTQAGSRCVHLPWRCCRQRQHAPLCSCMAHPWQACSTWIMQHMAQACSTWIMQHMAQACSTWIMQRCTCGQPAAAAPGSAPAQQQATSCTPAPAALAPFLPATPSICSAPAQP